LGELLARELGAPRSIVAEARQRRSITFVRAFDDTPEGSTKRAWRE